MKTTKNYFKCLSFILIAVIAVISVFSLTSCMTSEKNEHAEQATRELIEILKKDDYQQAYKIFQKYIKENEFKQGYAEIIELFKDVDTFSLKQVGWYTHVNNGISTYTATYEMTCGNKDVILIQATFLRDTDEMVSFHASGEESSQPTATIPSGLKIGFLAFSILCIVFMIFMIVDCAKRRINRKILYILLILSGLSLSFTVADGIKFSFSYLIALPLSQITSQANAISVVFALPIGAIIYFFLRKSVTIKPPATEDTDSTSSVTVRLDDKPIEEENGNDEQVNENTQENVFPPKNDQNQED